MLTRCPELKIHWFSILDLESGYWQVPIAPEDQEKTVFLTPMRLYEFLQMPFGLNNAPAMCQWLMEQVLQRLEEHGLNLKPHKCHLFWENIKYLGHPVSREEVQLLEDKVQAVQGWATP